MKSVIQNLQNQTISVKSELETVEAPFTYEETQNINEFQVNGRMHPFTCGGSRTDKWHLDGEGVLLATRCGLICLYCGYKQTSCYKFMTEKQPEVFIFAEEK